MSRNSVVLLDLEGERRGGVRHHAGQTARVERAFLEVELPGPFCWACRRRCSLFASRLTAPSAVPAAGRDRRGAVQAAGSARSSAWISSSKIGGEDRIVRIGVRVGRRGRGFQRRLALGQFGLVALSMSAESTIDTWAMALVLLFVLAALGAGLGLSDCCWSSPALSGLSGSCSAILAGIVLVVHVGVIAQLVAIAEIGDDPARHAGEGSLIGQDMIEIAQRAAGLFLDEGRARGPSHAPRPWAGHARWRGGARDSPQRWPAGHRRPG